MLINDLNDYLISGDATSELVALMEDSLMALGALLSNRSDLGSAMTCQLICTNFLFRFNEIIGQNMKLFLTEFDEKK